MPRAQPQAHPRRRLRSVAVLIIFSSMPDFSIGVDLGGTNLRIAAISGEGELLEKITLATKLALGRDHVIDEMCDAIRQLAVKYKGTGNFIGAGIGVPGLMDMQTGTVRKAANLPGWENYPVRAEIERRLGLPETPPASCSKTTRASPPSANNGWVPRAASRMWRWSLLAPGSVAASCSLEKSGTV